MTSVIKLSEHQIQTTLISELGTRLRREVLRCAIPNGGLRNIRVAQQLKAEGLTPGMPDLLFAYEGGRTAWIEMKTAKGGLSDAQVGVRYKLEQLGHQWALARSPEEALAQLSVWGLLR